MIFFVLVTRLRVCLIAKIVAEEITPLVPAVPGEKVTDDHICSILQIILKFMVLQVSRCSLSVSAHSCRDDV